MKVILQENVDNVGHVGDIVNVSDGFGRNFLIPRGKALQADERNVRVFEHHKRLAEHRRSKIKGAAEDLAKRIGALTITIAKQAGENDRVFGSVTALDIEESLRANGVEISRRLIHIEEPIKNIGVFNVPVKLHPEVVASLRVFVVKKEE